MVIYIVFCSLSNMFGMWQIILLIIIIFILYFYTYNLIKTFNNENDATETINTSSLLNFTFERKRGTDCVLNRLPCVIDQQCRDSCLIVNRISELKCQEGFCNATSAENQIEPHDCDSSLGLIKVFAVGGDFVVSQTCVSTYRDLVDDIGAIRPYLCDDGELTLNLNVKQFSVQACECLTGYEKMSFRQAALARVIPVCIPLHLVNLYKRVYV
ncbi:pif3 [Oxyplax ochracea nucleopolyhedrovirus]|uniref:Pif3 n=1 Tax=Oxyplax ochracea nucleopolyhedrovirus TaxID=2083176 RepID=A0A2L0WU07_9ABAC|nr:pif3 [Oxyplax ochracea nucleopolyhedrovirus]AVA31130.1 pif3 [Oxyplax ochracea nucleopolyhedrovirus]